MIRGGKRKGAGRKKLAPTVILSFRVNKSISEYLKCKIKTLINETNQHNHTT
jgi:hypothetical protein